MAIPAEALLFVYFGLLFCLGLIVRWAYRHRRDAPTPKRENLEREIRFPYTPPPQGRKRAFDWSANRYRQDSAG